MYAWVSAVIVAFALVPTTVRGETNTATSGVYGSLFGGLAWGAEHAIRQDGVAHRRGDQAVPGYRDFDLVVDTRGHARQRRSAIFGANIGYRFNVPDARLAPAIELEGVHLSPRQHGELANPVAQGVVNLGTGPAQARLADPTSSVAEKYGPGKHRFETGMRVDTSLLMLNAVFAYRSTAFVEPYVGIGIGLAFVDAKQAVSHQTHPDGPIELTPDTGEAVNHFNSDTRDRDFAMAWQFKAGLRAPITKRISTFVEYRVVYVGSTEFDFGSTRYSGHVATDGWQVRHGVMRTRSAMIGVQYAL